MPLPGRLMAPLGSICVSQFESFLDFCQSHALKLRRVVKLTSAFLYLSYLLKFSSSPLVGWSA